MCGLLFLHFEQGISGPHRQQAERALDRIAHRGPDDHGLVGTSDTLLGHRRLAIIDLNASRQPMQDPGGRYFLVYNGEVYNYRELRSELASAWDFRSAGDTEVVLAGLILHGDGFVQRMDGMWAFAFWDSLQKKLLLCRDRMGKKPLYYRRQRDSIACASELPALQELTGGSWCEDESSTADYLRYGYYLPGTTAYQSVQEVLPGHVLSWSRGNRCVQRGYWSLRPGGFSGQEAQGRERLESAMIRAVRKRMIADVEVGAFLSGGVDSSLVTALMTTHCNVSPQTFTIGFSDASYDERQFARLVAEHLHTRHHEEILRDWDTYSLQSLVFDHVGQPFADSSILPAALVSAAAASRVKVALSGDGGDELFSGYQRYQARAILRWYSRLPAICRKSTEKLVRALPEPMAHHSRSIVKKAHLFLDIAERNRDETPYTAPLMYSGRDFAKLVPDLAARGHSPPGLPAVSSVDDLQAMMAADALIYLPQDILLKVDRASMAASLEVRAPFLDREVVDLAFSMPRRWHRRGRYGKRMLHTTFGGLLPAQIWARRKQGFGVPVHEWFRNEPGRRLETLLQETRSPLDHSFVLGLLQSHRRQRRDHGHRLWSIYIYLLWRQRQSR